MGELASALDGLAGEHLAGLFAPALLDRLSELLRAQNRLAAEVARTVRECELAGAAEFDGLKNMAGWLRGHARLSHRAAQELVDTGRALEHLPRVAAAFADGQVTAGQAGLAAQVTTPGRLAEAAAAGVDLAVIDTALTTVATTQPYGNLVAAVRYYRDALDPDGPEPDPTEGRRFSLARHLDGMRSLSGQLDAMGAEKLQAALESIVAAGRCAGDTRTRAQQYGDALVQLAENALASGSLPIHRTVKPHVVVTINLDDLTDTRAHPAAAATGLGDAWSAAQARWAACDASIRRIVLDPDGLPLDVGREKRVVPPHLRRAVEHRDGQCVFAGCEAPTWFCDVHHLLEWMLGGETSLANSALLCERHHTKAHHGFRVERDPGGRWHTYRPDGTEILIGPRLFDAA
jgi:hypothetical protein